MFKLLSEKEGKERKIMTERLATAMQIKDI